MKDLSPLDWIDPRDDLKRLQKRPIKGLSQNFLLSPKAIQSIADLVPEGYPILEIGPGTGALTRALLPKASHYTAIELDALLAEHIGTLSPTIEVFSEDILSWDHPLRPETILVGNLPYRITKEILLQIAHYPLKRAVLMVQKEVAQKLMEPCPLSIYLQNVAAVQKKLTISKRLFYPSPKVDSAILLLDFHPPHISELDAFFKMLQSAFSQRRKQIGSWLSSCGCKIKFEFDKKRPEQLPFSAWQIIYNCFKSSL